MVADSVAVWRLIEPGGIVIWDDYEWAPDFAPEQRCKGAIDDFLHEHEGEYRLLVKEYQVIVQRIR